MMRPEPITFKTSDGQTSQLEFSTHEIHVGDGPMDVMDFKSNDGPVAPRDFFERNPDLIKAEMDLLSTPHSAEYRDKAYQAITNIGGQCSADYYANCAQQDGVLVFDMDNFLVDFFANRRRNLAEVMPVVAEKAPTLYNTAVKPVAKVFSLYGLTAGTQHLDSPRSTATVDGGNRKFVRPMPSSPHLFTLRGGLAAGVNHMHMAEKSDRRMLEGDFFSTHDRPNEDKNRPPPGEDKRKDKKKPPSDDKDKKKQPPNDNNGGDMNKQPPVGDDKRKDDEHHRHGHDHRSPYYDDVYTGAIGYGPQGDMCMYQSYGKLSSGCQTAIKSVFALRQQYWSEDVEMSSHEGGFGHVLLPLLLGLFVVVGLIKRCGPHRKHRKDAITILKAIEANPALKAAVEAEAGVSLPPLPKCHGARNGQPSKCIFRRACRFLMMATLTLISSFLIAVSSLIISSNIIMGMVHEDSEGNTTFPSHSAAISIVVMVTLAELTLVFGTIHLAKRYYKRRQARNAQAEIDSAPANPAVFNTRSDNDSAPSAPSPASSFRSSRLAYAYNSFFPSRTAVDGYVPLAAADTTEMVSTSTGMSSSGSKVTNQNIHYGIPVSVPIPGQVVYVPAKPVGSSVNMF